jgi:hypothetical protein
MYVVFVLTHCWEQISYKITSLVKTQIHTNKNINFVALKLSTVCVREVRNKHLRTVYFDRLDDHQF